MDARKEQEAADDRIDVVIELQILKAALRKLRQDILDAVEELRNELREIAADLREDADAAVDSAQWLEQLKVRAARLAIELIYAAREFGYNSQAQSLRKFVTAMQTALTETQAEWVKSREMSRRFLEPLAGTPFWEGHQKVYRKVRGALGEQALRFCKPLNRTIRVSGFGASDYTKRGQMIDTILQAMEDRRRVLVVYQSQQSTEPVEQDWDRRGSSGTTGVCT